MKKLFYLVIFFIYPFILVGQEKGNLKIIVNNMDYLEGGTVMIHLFEDNKAFPGKYDKASLSFMVLASEFTGEHQFDSVEYGTYAVSIVQDTDGNGKLTMKFFQLKEGVGLSNDPPPRMGPPRFKDASFELNNSDQEIVINMKYYHKEE